MRVLSIPATRAAPRSPQGCGPALTRPMLTEMARGQPDVIVFELGDGLLGTYGVQSILQDAAIKSALTAVVVSANDPVAAWGGIKLLRERFGIEPAAVTGPATDNLVGIEIIREQMNVEAFNAIGNPADLGDFLIARAWGAATPALRKWSARERGDPGHRFGRHRICGRRAVALDRRASAPRTVAAILSDSQPGAPVAASFPAFAKCLPGAEFHRSRRHRIARPKTPRSALFSAAPHGVAAGIIDRLLTAAETAGTRTHCVDISADFRYATAGAYEAVYKHAHGAPNRIRHFTCAVPEHLRDVADAARIASGMLRHCHPAGERATAGPGVDRHAAVRHRHHRQHRVRP